MSKTIISLENVSKAYDIYAKPSDFVRELITRKPCHDVFWALNDITFAITEKQRVGIIGPNGSGKSTLLKIITGNLQPTRGKVSVTGAISAMLSLNTVLNPEETGLSNIRFNLILSGCDKSELDELTEEIIEFTELGSFIYAPVKTYSSGMNAKLAFAIATAIKPEILIVDEVLSVGDAYFMSKATKRMIDLCNKGKGLIFVSHSMSSIQMLCDSVIWMENGQIRNAGPTDYVLKLYEEDFRKQEDETAREGNVKRKNVLAGSADLSEVDNLQNYRVRVVPENESRTFQDTHYIRKITLSDERLANQNIALSMQDARKSADVHNMLDVLDSEWSRLYVKDGHDCRVLAARTGKRTGGQIIIRPPSSGAATWSFKLAFDACSMLNKEKLRLEYLDFRTGTWERGRRTERTLLDGNWYSVETDIELPIVDEQQFRETMRKVQANAKASVEILDVSISHNDQAIFLVGERQPFTIDIRINANRPTAVADVGIRIIRSDGVYVFWQSSGLTGENLNNVDGSKLVRFVFKENPFPAGEYLVSAYIANGWDFPSNYPYSEVFDRKINALKFSVRHEWPGLDFGAVNMRVPIVYSSGQG